VALEAKGKLRRLPRRSRAMEPVAAAADGLRLLGRIAAGRPLEAVPAPDSLALPWQGRGDVFALEVRGDSMIDEQIRSGDEGQIVVALIDGEDATVKRFHAEPGGRIRLAPANAAMEPTVFPAERVRIQGVVLGVLRKY
jgi:repressor LexA